MPYIELEELTLYYEEMGCGQPLFLVTGFGMDISAWYEHTELFSRYFRVVLLELRGSGKSSVPEPGYLISDMASDVIAAADHLGVEKFHYCGFSLGGAIGLHLGIHNSPRLLSLSLHSTWEASEARPHMQRWIELRRRIIASGDEVANVNSRIASFFSPQFINSHPERIERWIEFQRNNPNPTTAKGADGHAYAIQRHDAREGLERVTAPTLLTVGTQDRTTLPESSHYICERIGSAEMILLNGAAHNSIYESKEEFATIALGFLLKHARSAPSR